jgi:hypothetical protein
LAEREFAYRRILANLAKLERLVGIALVGSRVEAIKIATSVAVQIAEAETKMDRLLAVR